MSDLIRREDVLCGKFVSTDSLYERGWNDALDAVAENAPAVDAVEVNHAFWRDGFEMQTCSACAYRGKRSYRYCPSCGAKMDGKRREEET